MSRRLRTFNISRFSTLPEPPWKDEISVFAHFRQTVYDDDVFLWEVGDSDVYPLQAEEGDDCEIRYWEPLGVTLVRSKCRQSNAGETKVEHALVLNADVPSDTRVPQKFLLVLFDPKMKSFAYVVSRKGHAVVRISPSNVLAWRAKEPMSTAQCLQVYEELHKIQQESDQYGLNLNVNFPFSPEKFREILTWDKVASLPPYVSLENGFEYWTFTNAWHNILPQ